MHNTKIVRNIALISLLSIFLVLGLSFSLKWLKQLVFLPIEVVALTDKLQYAESDAIKAVVSKYVQQGFFSLDVQNLRAELKTIPWIADANVQRCWPNTVKIKIFERQPLAIWQGQGIVDTEGKLFFPLSIANVDGLPEFIGDAAEVDSMVDMYLLILARLKPIGLAVNRLAIVPNQGWRVLLDNGITLILGQMELEERLMRFVWAYNSMTANHDPIKIVDLRYTNGLSIA